MKTQHIYGGANLHKYETLEDAFASETDGYEYADNYRCAELGDVEAMEDYTDAMRRGCCGRRDLVVLVLHSVELGGEIHQWWAPHLLGFNYGH